LTNILTTPTKSSIVGLRTLRKKESNMITQNLKAMAASYLRTALAAVAGAYLAGHTDLKTLGYMFLAAILGPLARALNPKDTSFGVTK
jgi:hypothetical protein